MTDFLAKTNPPETIIEHTNHLLHQYKLLYNLYGEKININWTDLQFVCKWHDVGKINPQFQQKLKGQIITDEIFHNFISTILMQPKQLIKQYEKMELTKDEAIYKTQILCYAVANHHDRPLPLDYLTQLKTKILPNMLQNIEDFPFNQLDLDKPTNIKMNFNKYIKLGYNPNKTDDFYDDYVKIKGFLNKIDYAASGHYPIEINNKTRQNKINEWIQNHNIQLNSAQTYATTNKNKSTIFIAQTGIGKTEAALLWADEDKTFFTLPLQAAINNIYHRVKQSYVENSKSDVGLLHSNTKNVLLTQEKETLNDSIIQQKLAKSLSYPLTITTLDQIFKFVYFYKGFEPLYVTLMYSKIIIDEIQAYDPVLLSYLLFGLTEIEKIGGKYLIMSATIPPYMIDLMKKQHLNIPDQIPVFYDKNKQNRHHVHVHHDQINTDTILQTTHTRNLIICNTVKKAKEIYNQLLLNTQGFQVKLLHSRFIKKDRNTLEHEIISDGQNINAQNKIIWVTTQIVEASLDIDFDCLYTELSELSGLFQRMGRCYRSRNNIQNKPNVHIFNGGSAKTSGIGRNKVIDPELFELSKTALTQLQGAITEREKIKCINTTFTTENLKDSNYLSQIKDALLWLENNKNQQNPIKESEAKRLFRNIQEQTIIPSTVYEENQIELDTLIEILESTDTNIPEKIKATNQLMDYTLSIPYWDFKQNATIIRNVQLSQYEEIPIVSADYSFNNNNKIGFIGLNQNNHQTSIF